MFVCVYGSISPQNKSGFGILDIQECASDVSSAEEANERAVQASERADKRVAQYLRPDCFA